MKCKSCSGTKFLQRGNVMTPVDSVDPLHSSFPEEFWAVRKAGRQNITASLRDDELVFELGAPFSVFRHTGPSVRPGLIFVGSLVDHGLDGEHVADLHDANGFIVGIVGNVRGAVEELANAVAAVGLDDAESLGVGVLGDDVANLPVLCPRLAVLDGLHQAFVGGLDEQLAGLARRADDKCLVKIAVIALVEHRDVDVHNIAVLQLSAVGDPVTDDLVDGRAHRFGKVKVVQWRRVCPKLDTCVMNHFVNVIGRDAHGDRGVGPVQDETADSARLPDTGLALIPPLFHYPEFILWRADFRDRDAPLVVVRLWDRVGKVPLRTHTSRAEGPCPLERRTSNVPASSAIGYIVPRMWSSSVYGFVLFPYVLRHIERRASSKRVSGPSWRIGYGQREAERVHIVSIVARWKACNVL